MRRTALALAGIAALAAGVAIAAEEPPPIEKQRWSFNGPFGTFDRASLQRGFQVYQEVCAVCHPVTHLAYRNLTEIGFSEDEVKAIASQAKVTDGPNDAGEMFERPGRPSDAFILPFPNEKAARAANNGALPVDLSLVTKAREGGPDYVFALLNGYRDPPAEVKLGANMRYNIAFAAGNDQIAMPPPLSDDAVSYADGTKATTEQMARDVVTFLSWAAEPNLEARHKSGFAAILFLIVTTGFCYAVKRKIWAKLH